ncbi:dual 3',5'-cyclic-AMP and -GMP phosphodiesterase 11 [Caerostris darwini]|uniref:Phosphodiesterase n=1 Tax=Caerostris darwini TaxID=1538125 RepID=A0AAV4UHR4_9ARAC|nr:dual 3',5'-cyclic-AMP and -GMP phosphodiesterase 11 [Caerostris darwini]
MLSCTLRKGNEGRLAKDEKGSLWRLLWQPAWHPRGGSALGLKKTPPVADIMGESSDGNAADGQACDDHHEEIDKVESWLDEHPHFVHDYFVRKASRHMVDSWLLAHSAPQGMVPENSSSNSSPTSANSGAATPVRKISAHELESRTGLSRPILNTTSDGIPTFLSLPLPGDAVPLCNSTSGYLVRKTLKELRSLDERELIFELVKDICNDLELRSLCHKILQNVSILTDADRCSLFLVKGEKDDSSRCLVSQLFDVSCSSTIEQMQQKEEIRIPWGTGIVGHVAECRESLNIHDCYKDDRFNSLVDRKTGYKTHNMLCMPILDVDGEVKGVAQIINKCRGEEPFTDTDEKVFSRYLQFCGIGLRNAELYERSELENKRNQVLLDLARMVFEEQSTIGQIVHRIMTHTQSLLQIERCQILLLGENTKTFSRAFDLDVNDMKAENIDSSSPFEGRFPINVGITGYVATTGETLNIPDVLQDDRFDPSVDDDSSFCHRSILCMPIRNASQNIVGVSQLINKLSGTPFTKNDEHIFEAFAIFCGLGIQNTQMYERAMKAIAKTKVTLEVLSYHATAPIEEVQDLLRENHIPATQVYKLHDLKFDDFSLKDKEMLKACLRMFMDLDLIQRFGIEYDVLCRWLLSVRKNYRPVTYHNWRHAFNVGQMMFAILTVSKLCQVLGELETLSLLIACLCHDLDHRGTNNSFQQKSSSPLAQLYSTSTMEHHHFDQCIMILNSEGNQILGHLSPEEYLNVVQVLEDAILATDLAVYHKRQFTFTQMVKKGNYNWKREDNRELLRAMLMTACDIAAITKPWEVQKRVAELVANEFFEQGDVEKQLKLEPIDMMNRDKKDKLPAMQVGFIDSMCLPVYEAFARISDKLKPLLDGVQENRAQWLKLSEEQKTLL